MIYLLDLLARYQVEMSCFYTYIPSFSGRLGTFEDNLKLLQNPETNTKIALVCKVQCQLNPELYAAASVQIDGDQFDYSPEWVDECIRPLIRRLNKDREKDGISLYVNHPA